MKLKLNKAHYPVTVLGPGNRVGIWFQGCSIGCPGCISKDTWDSTRSDLCVDVNQLASWCESLPLDDFQGITISGGEPFEQPEALEELIRRLLCGRFQQHEKFSIICYSGYRIEALQGMYPHILKLLDVVISDPFVASQSTESPLKGSENQRFSAFTSEGKAILTTLASDTFLSQPKLQIEVDENVIWCIGVPRAGDMDHLEKSLGARGITMGSVSWRA